jgi:hypothetical protein
LRRQFNLAFFKRLLIDDDYAVTGVLAEPFDALLGPELRRAVVVRTSQTLQDAIAQQQRQRATEGVVIENEQRPREPERLLVGAGSTTDFSFGGGSSTGSMVRPSGLESPRTVRSTRPSTGCAGCRCVRGVQMVQFVWVSGRIGRIWRGGCSRSVLTGGARVGGWLDACERGVRAVRSRAYGLRSWLSSIPK